MSKNKKYYWLKLKDDFFNNKEIKKLRKIAGGDTYIIIYLKMQLLSIKKGGAIQYDQTEENVAEQLSLELDESVDNIKMVLSFMEANNLIEKLAVDNYMLTKVPSLIGKETDAAERMRNMRERNNVTQIEAKSIQKGNNVTPMLQNVTQRKEIEKREKRKEIKKEVYGEFSNVTLADVEYQKCIEKHGEKTTLLAIEKLGAWKEGNGKKTKSDYGTLNNWVWDAVTKKSYFSTANEKRSITADVVYS